MMNPKNSNYLITQKFMPNSQRFFSGCRLLPTSRAGVVHCFRVINLQSISQDVATLVDRPWSTNVAAHNKRKRLEFTLPQKRLLSLVRSIKYMCMNTSHNVIEMFKLLRIQTSNHTKRHVFRPALVTGEVTIEEIQNAVFSKQKTLRNWKKYLFLDYLYPSFTLRAKDSGRGK